MRVASLIAVLGSLLGASALVAVYLWMELGETQMSWHGYLALGLGAGLTIALGVGLMALVFLSNRRGHDDLAHQAGSERSCAPLPPTNP